MVGAINPNSTQTLEMQIGYAKSADYQLAPGEAAPREGVASSTPSSISESSGGKRISTGLMIGIAVGVVAFLAMCAALFFFIGRSRSLKESVKKHNERSMMKPIGVGGGGYHDLSMQHQNTHPQSQVTGGPYSPTPAQAEFGTPLPAYNQLHGGFGAPADHKYAHHTGISGHGQQYYK